MFFALATALLLGQLPNPLAVYTRDGAEHLVRFKGRVAVFAPSERPNVPAQGGDFEADERGRFVRATDRGGCDGAVPEIIRSELRLAPGALELVHTLVARPCRGNERVLGSRVQRFSYERPAPGLCATSLTLYERGGQRLTLIDACDDTVHLVSGEDRWIVSGRQGRYAGVPPTLKVQGKAGAPKVRVRGAGLDGVWMLVSSPGAP